MNRRTLRLGAPSSHLSAESILRLGFVASDAEHSVGFAPESSEGKDSPCNDMIMLKDSHATGEFRRSSRTRPTDKSRSMNTSSLDLNNYSSFEPIEGVLHQDRSKMQRHSSQTAEYNYRAQNRITFNDILLMDGNIMRQPRPSEPKVPASKENRHTAAPQLLVSRPATIVEEESKLEKDSGRQSRIDESRSKMIGTIYDSGLAKSFAQEEQNQDELSFKPMSPQQKSTGSTIKVTMRNNTKVEEDSLRSSRGSIDMDEMNQHYEKGTRESSMLPSSRPMTLATN